MQEVKVPLRALTCTPYPRANSLLTIEILPDA